MSKLAKKPIAIKDIDSSFNDNILVLKGKHGELSIEIPSIIQLNIENDQISVTSDDNAKLGLYYSLIKNNAQGVNNKFSKDLILTGVGFRASCSNNELNINLGYSHPVKYKVSENVSVEIVTPTQIKLSSIDKQLVGQVAEEIIQLRASRKDPYKKKGIREINEYIRTKVGKKVK
jgi:large subunit ribosomal protein L6